MAPLFDRFVGTGGIGSGIIFLMDDNRPLSRHETRLAALSDAKDYCKQHIILHYVSRVLSPQSSVHAVGAVGRDAAGRELLAMMRGAGIDTAFVRESDLPTMYAVCLQYPDSAICNVTKAQSASSTVTPGDVAAALAALGERVGQTTCVVAAPEVPVPARLALLKGAGERGARRAASCLLDEAEAFRAGGGVENTDWLFLNQDEAAAFVTEPPQEPERLARACHEALRGRNPGIGLAVTFGSRGSWVCQGDRARHVPAVAVKAAATGGAGDAFLAGTLCGMALGLPFMAETGPLAAHLGSRLAAESVTSLDTIAPHIGRELAMAALGELLEKGGAA